TKHGTRALKTRATHKAVQMAPLTPGCPFEHSQVWRGRPVYVHLKGLANTWLKYSINTSSFVRKSSTDVKLPRRTAYRVIIPKTISIWLSHELCLGVYTNRMRWLSSDRNSCRLRIDWSTPRLPFWPRSSGRPHRRVTNSTRVAEQWVLRLSRTKT